MTESVVYGYLRVSTGIQDLQGNKEEIILKLHDAKINSQNMIWIEETVSGTKHWNKRKLGNVIDKLKKNDVFITSELSRIGRTMTHINEFISILLKKEVKIIFTKTNFIVDDSVQSQTMIFALSMASQLERDMISTRTKDALARKKKEGVIMGRPKNKMKLDIYLDEIKKLINEGVKQTHIAKKYNTSTVTMSKFIKKNNLKNKF